jgi:hypothetical protein
VEERTKRGTRLRRTIVVLALGIAIGTMIVATPAGAHFRSSIDHIWSHIKTKADARYTRAVQPVGKTQSGVWGTGNNGTAGGTEWSISENNFKPRLPATIPAANVHYVGAANANCPGVGQAAAGHLCIYESFASNMTYDSTFAPELGTALGAGKLGFIMYFQADATFANAWGTWAVTPAASTASAAVQPAGRASDVNGLPRH